MPSANPHDQRLLEAFNNVADANTAEDAATIKGRIRIQSTTAVCESVKAAHRRWREENQ